MALELCDLSSPAIMWDDSEVHGAEGYALWPADDDSNHVTVRVLLDELQAATGRPIDRDGQTVWDALAAARPLIAERARERYRLGDDIVTLGWGDLRDL